MKKLYSIVVAFMMFFNLSLFAQDGPPWDFNGTDHGFVAQNYASLTVGDTYVTFTLNDADGDGDAESPNSNFRNLDAGIDTSLGGFIAITMKNETANNKMQAILGTPGGGCGCYVNFETLSANDADFVTHYINVGANSNWTGTLSEIIFRFKKGNGVNNQTYAGDILIDHIEIVESIPATPRVDYTFDDTSDSEGFSGVNGITLTQPVAGELHLDIAAQSPYPKLEQTGLYSVDADTYKYVQVTLVNNSPKNKLTLVSPSGGNEYSTKDMVANDGVAQTYELDLTALTNWNGTQANWWLQLVENPGDGPVASAGIIDIQQILFATESIMPPDLACDDSYSYTYGDNESGTLFSASNPGGEVTVTVTGQTEAGYDYLIIRDGAGNELYNASGDHTGQAITSTDGTITVEVDSDSSVSGYTIDFAVSCPAATTNVTFSVNTENIEVGANGIYVGGGVLGGSDAYALSDDDGDGVWETTIALAPGTTGNYIFFNSPNGSSDWGTKENLNGQDCADPANYDDRILDPVGEEDYTLLHCFGECSGNGTGECPSPSTTYDVTFSVNMSNYPGGLGDGNVFLNGNFNGWCGDCTPMSDDDGDGIWTVTVSLEDGDYEYKFTVNGWSSQEEFGSIGAVEGCTVTDGTYTNRSLTVAGADMTLDTVYWNLCPGETPGQVYNITFAVDTANISVGASGMYLGGGAFGDAQGHAMSDDDGDGVYEVTLEVSTDQAGANYIFLNGPGDGGDWGAKEDLAGQECADVNNYNDRMLPEFDGDTYLLHCFGDCSGDGVGCSAAPLEGSWCEDFDGESFPAEGWATFRGENGLGQGYDWEASSTYSVSGANSAHVRYEGITGGLAEDWLVTPMFIPDASNNHISFSHRQAYVTDYGSTYAVKVSTASQTIHADFTDIATWTEADFEPSEFTSIEFSLAEYIGVPIYVAFVMTNNDGDDWYIDDVCVQAGLSTTDNEILDMMVYPNPVDGNYVTILSPVEGLKEIQVFTVTGRKVMDTAINGNTLDVSSFNSGFYMLKVTINGQSKISKLVVR